MIALDTSILMGKGGLIAVLNPNKTAFTGISNLPISPKI